MRHYLLLLLLLEYYCYYYYCVDDMYAYLLILNCTAMHQGTGALGDRSWCLDAGDRCNRGPHKAFIWARGPYC